MHSDRWSQPTIPFLLLAYKTLQPRWSLPKQPVGHLISYLLGMHSDRWSQPTIPFLLLAYKTLQPCWSLPKQPIGHLINYLLAMHSDHWSQPTIPYLPLAYKTLQPSFSVNHPFLFLAALHSFSPFVLLLIPYSSPLKFLFLLAILA